MRTEAPIPTVVEVTHKHKGRLISRWAILWSDGHKNQDHASRLDDAIEQAAYAYTARCLWAEDRLLVGGAAAAEWWRH